MKQHPLVLFGLAALAVPLIVLAAAQGDQPAGEGDPAGKPLPVHRDVQALEDGVLQATRAFLREDPQGVRDSLQRIETATRRLDPEADEAYGSDLIVYEQAFHVTLDRSREFVIRGDMENGFNQFVWVQRACITCHGLAREQGLLPAADAHESAP